MIERNARIKQVSPCERQAGVVPHGVPQRVGAVMARPLPSGGGQSLQPELGEPRSAVHVRPALRQQVHAARCRQHPL